jgi:hypothetical protein
VDVWGALEGGRFGEPIYVRYQPGRRLVVLYESMAHLTVFKPGRTERLWARVAGSPLAERALGGSSSTGRSTSAFPGWARRAASSCGTSPGGGRCSAPTART